MIVRTILRTAIFLSAGTSVSTTSNSSFSSAASSPPPAAAPPATAIATGALLASTPNVSSIFDTSSLASTRVRPLMSSRMESTDASMRTDVGRAGGAMNPATATAEAAMRRRCIVIGFSFNVGSACVWVAVNAASRVWGLSLRFCRKLALAHTFQVGRTRDSMLVTRRWRPGVSAPRLQSSPRALE